VRILVIYAQPVFWSMGEGRGAAIFTRLPEAMALRGHEVRVCLPTIRANAGAGRDTAGFRETVPPAIPVNSGATSDTAGLAETLLPAIQANPGVPKNDLGLTPALPLADPYHGFLLHHFPARRGFVPSADLPLVPRLRDRLDCWLRFQRWGERAAGSLAAAFPPDLVLGMGHYEAPVARRVARRLGVPNVTRLFGNTLSLTLRSPHRFCANFPEVIALCTPADLVILNDDGASGEAVARRLRVPRDRFIHLRNGVDFARFRPGPPSAELRQKLGIPDGRFMLMTGTRLAPEKKLERAIVGLRDLIALGVDAVLVLPGAGPERTRLETEARAAGMADRVLFPGPVRQEEMAEWYRTADIFLSLLDRTNAANPVFEAMACGCQVVALDAGTTRAVVRDGETGVVLPFHELPCLGPILRDLLLNAERRRRMGAAAAVAIPTLVMNLCERLDYEARLVEDVGMRRAERALLASNAVSG
jgi:glycosyltransferase involved in cell wall biosynthesis